MPFVWYRLLKPDNYGLEQWWKEFRDWQMVLPAFLKAFTIYIGGRLFNSGFFHWSLVNTSQLRWDGHWMGLASFVNQQYSVLLWLLLIVLAVSFWRKRQRHALLVLSGVMVCLMTSFTLVVTGVAYLESNVPHSFYYQDLFVNWDSGPDMGRYFFPFFIAWFLVILTLWFPEDKPPALPARQSLPHRALVPQKKSPRFSKHRR
jgi:hypothetical protein